MKKLLFWAVLLMTGFAFYSCDERFDNPVAERQDSSSPNATWSYEVGIKFTDFSFWHYDTNWNWVNTDLDGEAVTYKAPSTVYAYNKAGEYLGELTATEEFDYDAFDWNKYYKFAGTLKGAIGEEIVISTLKDFDYYSKQDGTLKSLAENSLLATADVPIIVADNSHKKIATQNVQLKSAISAFFARFDNGYSDDNDREFTVSADSLIATPSFEIKLAEAVKPETEGFFFAFATAAKESAKYTFEFNSEEKGIKGINVWEGYYGASNSINSIYYLNFTPKELDLSKYTKYLKEVKEINAPYYISVSTMNRVDYEPIITQSEKDALDVQLYISGKATIKDINLAGDYSYIQTSGSLYTYEARDPEYREESYLPTITLVGKNTVKASKQSYGARFRSNVTLKGEGELEIEGAYYGLYINSGWTNCTVDENWNYTYKYSPSTLTLTENAKVKTNGAYINRYNVSGEYLPCTLEVKSGSFESTGIEGSPAIQLYGGKVTIGTDATSFKATSGQTGDTPMCIAALDFTNYNYVEAKLENLVADKTKFTDETKDGVRTITPKK